MEVCRNQQWGRKRKRCCCCVSTTWTFRRRYVYCMILIRLISDKLQVLKQFFCQSNLLVILIGIKLWHHQPCTHRCTCKHNVLLIHSATLHAVCYLQFRSWTFSNWIKAVSINFLKFDLSTWLSYNVVLLIIIGPNYNPTPGHTYRCLSVFMNVCTWLNIFIYKFERTISTP